MPVPGRPPSAGPTRHRDATIGFDEFPADPYTGPSAVDPDPTWPLETLEWWGFVSAQPHCAAWHPPEWRYAKDTAHVHAQWIRTLDARYLTELRQREMKLGTTKDSRVAMRIKYVDTDTADTSAGVSPLRRSA